MPECVCLKSCSFIGAKTESMPATVEVLKKRLCNADYTQCARYTVFKSLHGDVPSTLLPNQFEVAKEIIAAATNSISIAI